MRAKARRIRVRRNEWRMMCLLSWSKIEIDDDDEVVDDDDRGRGIKGYGFIGLCRW